MELNKCNRCGAFFASQDHVCPKCEQQDKAEISKLKDFLANHTETIPFNSLSCQTGISEKNLNRFLQQPDFSQMAGQIGTEVKGNVSIQL